jgi:TPP-dependent pyruvate/acetoin dehydrogenase alpha subunit
VAAGIKMNGGKNMVWCFIGDMASTMGIFSDAHQFAVAYNLPIILVIEDNGMSTDTPTGSTVGFTKKVPVAKTLHYFYERTKPHCGTGTGKIVSFV